MRTFLSLLILIVIVGVAIGFYLGWFRVSAGDNEGKPAVTITVDKEKIEADKDKAVDKVQDLGNKAADKVTPTNE